MNKGKLLVMCGCHEGTDIRFFKEGCFDVLIQRGRLRLLMNCRGGLLLLGKWEGKCSV